jgi:hypothetical protein
MRATVGWRCLYHGGDVARGGHVVVVAEPLVRVAVDVQAYTLFTPWWMLMMRGGDHEGWRQ